MFKPSLNNLIPLILLIPSSPKGKSYGVGTKTYPDVSKGVLFYGTFRTYGGTERKDNGVYSIEDTAVIQCVYRTDIKADCRVVNAQTGAVYEIISEPENLNMLNKYLQFKVRRVKGGV